MNRRRTLVVVVWTFAFLAMAAFAIPFLGFLFKPDTGAGGELVFIDVKDLAAGQPRVVELSPHRAIVILRASAEQQRELASLNEHVWDPVQRTSVPGWFVHWAFSTGKFGGCRLRHQAAGTAQPHVGRDQAQWLGGYWAPGCEASYDYAGRAIKTARYAYGTYVGKSESLRAPGFDLRDDGRLAVRLD